MPTPSGRPAWARSVTAGEGTAARASFGRRRRPGVREAAAPACRDRAARRRRVVVCRWGARRAEAERPRA